MAKDKFLKGAMILTLAGLMVKVIGSVNRILLSRLLGGEGIGLYQIAYPIYLLILAVAAAGIPTAISIMVSELLAKGDRRNVKRVFKVSLKLMALVGLVLALLLFFAAGWLVSSGIIQDARAYYAIVALIPAVFFATILASFRGFFQGHQLMTPPACSQIIEQLVRVITMVLLAYVLLPFGLEYAAAGAAFGAVPGSITGLLVLSYFYRKHKALWQAEAQPGDYPLEKAASITKRLLYLAIPVSLANVLVPVSNIVDVVLVPSRLAAHGVAVEQATALFGYLTGMAQPLIMMATIPTMSLSASLVPAIREAFTLGDKESITSKARMAMKLCCLITVPAALGMSAFAEQISLLLYGTSKATVAIMHSGPAICLLGMQQITAGMLQGIKQINGPMRNMFIGILLKIAAVYLLTTEAWQIAGAAWATNINFGVTALLNVYLLYKAGISFAWQEIAKITGAACLLAVLGRLAYGGLAAQLPPVMANIAVLLLAVLIYAALLPLLRIVTKEELKHLPVVKKLVK